MLFQLTHCKGKTAHVANIGLCVLTTILVPTILGIPKITTYEALFPVSLSFSTVPKSGLARSRLFSSSVLEEAGEIVAIMRNRGSNNLILLSSEFYITVHTQQKNNLREL